MDISNNQVDNPNTTDNLEKDKVVEKEEQKINTPQDEEKKEIPIKVIRPFIISYQPEVIREYQLYRNLLEDEIKTYKYQGFNTALVEKEDKEKFVEAYFDNVKAIDSEFKQIRENIEITVEAHIKHLNEQIEETQLLLKKEEELLNLHLLQRDELMTDIPILKKELDGVKKKLEDEFKEFGKKKANIVQDRIEEITKEINLIQEKFEDLVKRKYEKGSIEYHLNETLKKLKNIAEEQLNAVVEKIKPLTGVHSFVYEILVTIGIISSLVSGWFFAIFVGETGLSKNDLLALVLKNIAKFGIEFYATTTTISGTSVTTSFPLTQKINMALGFLVAIFSFILIIGFLSSVSHWLFKKYLSSTIPISKRNQQSKNAKNSQSMNFSLGGDNESLKMRIKADSIYSFWIQTFPIVFIMGLLYIMLSFVATDVNDINSVMNSADGNLWGPLIAIGFAGFFFLYIINVIEPRRSGINEKQPNTPPNTKSNTYVIWEIKWELGLFIFLLVGCLIFGVLPNLIPSSKIPISISALLGFLAFVLLTGITLGYGIRFKGLLLSESILSNYLYEISQKMEEDGIIFKRKLEELYSQIHLFMRLKNDMMIGIVTGETSRVDAENVKKQLETKNKQEEKKENNNQNFVQKFWKRVVDYFSPKEEGTHAEIEEKPEMQEEEETIASYINKISEIEKKYFPEYKPINEVIDELEKVEKDYKKKVKLLWDMRERNSLRCQEIEEKIRQINGLRNYLKNLIVNQRYILDEVKKIVYFDNIKAKNAFFEGYNNGLFYHEADCGPYFPIK